MHYTNIILGLEVGLIEVVWRERREVIRVLQYLYLDETYYIEHYGFEKVYKQKEVDLFIRRNNVSLLALLEHKVKDHHASKVVRKLAPCWACLDHYASSCWEKKHAVEENI